MSGSCGCSDVVHWAGFTLVKSVLHAALVESSLTRLTFAINKSLPRRTVSCRQVATAEMLVHNTSLSPYSIPSVSQKSL